MGLRVVGPPVRLSGRGIEQDLACAFAAYHELH